MKRLTSIDVMRTVAILLMIQIHFVENLSQPGEYSTIYQISSILGTLSAPIFTFLVGISLFISFKRMKALGKLYIRNRTIKRGIFLFFVGLSFAFTIWGPEYLFDWDVLTLIAFSILILYPLRSLKPAYLVLISLGIIILSPMLRKWTGYFSYWNREILPPEYTYELTFSDIFWGFWVNGYFPVFPWIVFPILGFVTGQWFLNSDSDEIKNKRHHILFWVGISMVLSGVIILFINSKLNPSEILSWYLSPYEFYPATTSFIIINLGLLWLLFYFLRIYLDLRAVQSRRWITFFHRYSRFSLTTYVVHHAVHLWPLRIAGAVWHQDHMYYYANVMSPPLALVLAFIFTLLFYFCLSIWDRYGSKYSLEWIQSRFLDYKSKIF